MYKYDAWNRLVEVKRKVVSGTAPTIATYRYDGLGRRIYKNVDHSGDRNRTEYFYYNNRWQLLEVRNQDDKATRQFVWGTQYIDEAVCMDVDTDTSGEGYGNCTDAGSKRYFYCQDANWNVIALREGSSIVERYEYDPYGECRVLKGYASAENQEDLTVTGEGCFLDIRGSDPAVRLPYGNPIRFAGYFFDNETQRYHVRNRDLDPRLGRWMQEDPLGYVDGANLYEYVAGNSVNRVDPTGLWTRSSHRAQTWDAVRAWAKRATETPSATCAFSMYRRLADANVGQDSGEGFSEYFRHYNRHFDEPPGDAKRKYKHYIGTEVALFNTSMLNAAAATKEVDRTRDCITALEALGRVSHSWQDYFAHAVLTNGEAAPAWSATPPITGTPDEDNPELIPSSYSKRRWGEHPPAWEPLEGGSEEQKLRLRDSIDFVSGKFLGHLTRWYAICKCRCPFI